MPAAGRRPRRPPPSRPCRSAGAAPCGRPPTAPASSCRPSPSATTPPAPSSVAGSRLALRRLFLLDRQHRPGGVGEVADVRRERPVEPAINLVGGGLHDHADRGGGGE